MTLKVNLVVLLVFCYLNSFGQKSTFLNEIKSPLHYKPNFHPETYDQKGYKKLLDTLIRWEMTRSMYDYKFGGSLPQIKLLSEITKSEFGKGMFHYFEGIRNGLGDPLKAETEFLQALDYFKANQDTSGILHTTMHLLRVNLNTTMINIGRIERYKSLYEEMMLLENHLKDPLDQVIFYRIRLIYDYNFKGVNSKSSCQESITKGLKLVEELTEKYNYFKFLMLNAIAIYHSININTIESEKYHLLSYEYIKNQVCLETKHTLRRIATMQYINKKYTETLKTLENIDKIPSNPNIQPIPELDGHIQLTKGMAYLHTNDLKNGVPTIEDAYKIFYEDFFVVRHRSYMKDMAAVYKNEQNLKSLYNLKKKQLNLILIIIIFIAILFVALIYTRFKSKANKKLQKEIKKRDFIYSMIGHDLSSPILAMDNTLNHIEMTLNDRLTSTQKSYISQLKSEINGAHYLLLNLLHWYKSDIELFGNKLGKSTSSIKNNIDQSVQHLFLQSKEIPVIFKNECADHIVYNLNVDMFNTVLRNIIDNAIKHSECTIITVNAIIRNEKLLVTIHDNGNGMDPKFVQSFNQSNSIYDLNRSEIKIGLGTIFILEFAKSMNSTIKIISNIEGSTYNWEIDK